MILAKNGQILAYLGHFWPLSEFPEDFECDYIKGDH